MPKKSRSPRVLIEDTRKKTAVAALKRTLRRLQKGQHIPFLVATIEPKQADRDLVAVPVVMSQGIEAKQNRFILSAIMQHLTEIGALAQRSTGGGDGRQEDQDAPDGSE